MKRECDCDKYCTCWVAVDAPLECRECAFCMSREEMYAEIPVHGGWADFETGPGFVMRIGCLCDAAPDGDKDAARTEFGKYQQAIDEWNEMMNLLAESLS